jgi:hypothetical protein
MRIDNPTPQQLESYFSRLERHCTETVGAPLWTKYLDLGTCVVRVINYSKEFAAHIEKQLTFVLKDAMPRFDTTLVVWKDDNINTLSTKLEPQLCDPKKNLRIRVEMIVRKAKGAEMLVYADDYSKHKPLININTVYQSVTAYNPKVNTWYYGIANLEPEEFIKHGHIFVQILNQILKTQTTSLVHGAVVGIDNHGILLCARGQRGKSTLAVLAMLDGFEYVSDDYLILEKDGADLYSHPIYSIITLSPRMYNELYDKLNGKFISNNARKDKYVINIADYHDSFRTKYPIKVCMFPEIVPDAKPSIVPCKKGRAITQLIHSTIVQMGDKHDIATIRKLISWVKDFEFYQINLCPDIQANNDILREFIKNVISRKQEMQEPKEQHILDMCESFAANA